MSSGLVFSANFDKCYILLWYLKEILNGNILQGSSKPTDEPELTRVGTHFLRKWVPCFSM